MDRRQFIKAGAATVALAAMPRAVWAQTDQIYDTVVVGGGVSGCYAGWRLRTLPTPQNVLLLEGSDRIGGRLYTVTHPEAPHLHAEVGGMRFPKSHETVYNLAEHLGLKIRPFPMGGPSNRMFLRDRHLKLSDLKIKGKLPYNLLPTEQGMSPMDLLGSVMLKHFSKPLNLDAGPAAAYLRNMQLKGRPLYQWGVHNMLESMMSVEAWHYIQDAAGYLSIISNTNAYDMLMQYAFYELPEPYFTLVDGFQSLPLKLAEQYQKAGGQLAMNTRLTRINKVGDGLEVVAVGPDGQTRKIRTKNVILAMPRRALELLDPGSIPFQSQQFLAAMQSVEPVHASKLFFWWDQEWWTKLGLSSGSAATDLPMRQCYYFGTEKMSPANTSGLLLTSYSDQQAAGYWGNYYKRTTDALQEDPAYSNRGSFAPAMAPSKSMVSDALSQLEKVHQMKLAMPHSAIYRNWQENPYGAGWHQWSTHVKSWEIIPQLRKPLGDANVFVCGEAYSYVQGWVRGALDSTERLLSEQFGTTRPAWVSKGYDFGP